MNDMILILNFSDAFALETARRLRAEQIYSRIISGATSAEQIRALAPRGIILSGEAYASLGVLDAGVLEMDVPVLALGHAAHMMLAAMGGACAGTAIKEKKAAIEYSDSPLFADVTGGERYLKETLTLMLPPEVEETARASGCTIAFEHKARKLYGVQFELERNDPDGSTLLKNFARDICGCEPWWSAEAILRESERKLAEIASRGGSAVCALSGGVDSLVAAVLTHRAFGDRMLAVFVDTGLMRQNEGQQIQMTCQELGIPMLRTDRSGDVLEALRGKRGGEEKREVVTSHLREEVIRQAASVRDAHTLVLGTTYSDLLSFGSSHAAAWQASGMAVCEPLDDLFKDEVRLLARHLQLGEEIVERKPFPMLGLAARIPGDVTGERLHALRIAEAIFREELCEAGLDRKLHKYFPVLAGGDVAMGNEMMILRAVTLSGGMLMPARLPYDVIERTVGRILREAPMVARVLYDETPTAIGSESFS